MHIFVLHCVLFTLQADHEKVISGSYDSTLKVWDLSTGECLLTLRYVLTKCNNCAFITKERYMTKHLTSDFFQCHVHLAMRTEHS